MKHHLGILFLILFGFANSIAQSNQTLEFLYGSWYFSKSESSNDKLVYKKYNHHFKQAYNSSVKPALSFKKDSNVFMLSYDNGKVYRRCGNDTRKNRIASWNKGIWSLDSKMNKPILILSYYEAEKGKNYSLTNKNTFYMLNLDYERMTLVPTKSIAK
ncbi:hypothetical protein MTsPCn9_14800 [Croceitalea sp. MTPC9]|uniref:hypothetical protein n=1 Tax=unclassified Croceitalea TaxID=2632280 RepID=UPI002B3F05DC|nr:hypothetical protein MTsPCn6_14330 [Croceitalea sp. MTPC6]GMN16544.1 hypothetical protein MTsPCn9_14800 [Croceitalea sp. MTPC9]